MNKMRLTRDKKWFFQYFPYHQMQHLVFVDAEKGVQMENLLAACGIMNLQK